MTSASDFTEIALGLDGTISAPHFDRTAFKVRRPTRRWPRMG